jgi:hypothetical protein
MASANVRYKACRSVCRTFAAMPDMLLPFGLSRSRFFSAGSALLPSTPGYQAEQNCYANYFASGRRVVCVV